MSTTDYENAPSARPLWIAAAIQSHAAFALSDQITREDGRIVLFGSYYEAMMAAFEANEDGAMAVEEGALSSWDTMYPVPVSLSYRNGRWIVTPVDPLGAESLPTIPYATAIPCEE